MTIQELTKLSVPSSKFDLDIPGKYTVTVYPKSVMRLDPVIFLMARQENEKYLYTVIPNGMNDLISGMQRTVEAKVAHYQVYRHPLNHSNAQEIQRIFPFTRPQLIGLQNSFGFGDRLGLANPGHLKALEGSSFKPVLAQQSIRELERTGRTPEEVMDTAVWAVMQEGYRDGFGADADHLKTTGDIDLMVNAGFTMFTFDPGDHVNNLVDEMSEEELSAQTEKLSWDILNDTLEGMQKRYLENPIRISSSLTLKPQQGDLLRSLGKYGKALVHIRKMYSHLKDNYPDHPAEIEISVDETESVTSPFEHFFMASELKRMGVEFISLAPRFIGRFEKGIDYRGDLDLFRREYEKHLQICRHFETYKISLHSGSDKFSAYEIIGSFPDSRIHVKTAGTSYLEALKVLAVRVPDFFRSILDFSRGLYEEEKKTYHVSADLNRVKPADQYSDKQLLELFQDDNARQVLHVTFGRVLTERDDSGGYLYRDKILNYLRKYEETYDEFLLKHFRKHLDPFQKLRR